MSYYSERTIEEQAEYDKFLSTRGKRTTVLRAVVLLTYVDDEPDILHLVQSPHEAEKDIERVLRGGRGLEYTPTSVEVVDAEYHPINCTVLIGVDCNCKGK